jgi:hypothetical protein
VVTQTSQIAQIAHPPNKYRVSITARRFITVKTATLHAGNRCAVAVVVPLHSVDKQQAPSQVSRQKSVQRTLTTALPSFVDNPSNSSPFSGVIADKDTEYGRHFTTSPPSLAGAPLLTLLMLAHQAYIIFVASAEHAYYSPWRSRAHLAGNS